MLSAAEGWGSVEFRDGRAHTGAHLTHTHTHLHLRAHLRARARARALSDLDLGPFGRQHRAFGLAR